ncbi:MAG: YceI family protein [Frankia sp.]|nr:YceI family protein [Frankia sp.]
MATPEPGRYRIDPASSVIRFRTRHVFGLLPVRGTFAIRSGTIDIAEPVVQSSVHVEIEAASFHTGNAVRDAAVRSARFLDADRYPVMTFVSERLDDLTLPGMLTIRGVTRPADATVQDVVLQDLAGEGPVGQPAVPPRRFTARATARIDRTEFGVTASRGMAGSRLDLSMEITCVRI